MPVLLEQSVGHALAKITCWRPRAAKLFTRYYRLEFGGMIPAHAFAGDRLTILPELNTALCAHAADDAGLFAVLGITLLGDGDIARTGATGIEIVAITLV